MPRYFLQIAYKGTAYHGWQRQPNAQTVQATLEDALCRILRTGECVTTGCGRTDTGVHASSFFLHFDLEESLAHPDIVHALNSLLPADIAAYRCAQVADEAHARFDATERSYSYHIHQRKDVFVANDSALVTHALDIEAMNAAATLLLEQDDFASFAKAKADHHTSICRVCEAQWTASEHHLRFDISADRFLRNMVRAIVGTLLEVGMGRMDISAFQEVLEAKDRQAAGKSVSADGLYLRRIVYPYIESHG